MATKATQKYKYLENEERFYDEIEAFFINFKQLSLKQIKQ